MAVRGFHQLPTTKKGKVGEKIVAAWYRDEGWIVMVPQNKRKAHLVDMVIMDDDDCEVRLVEVKTYPARRVYGDTGVDYEDFLTYCKLAENFTVRIVFVDCERRSVYSLALTPENIQAARIEGEKAYWDLKLTNVLFALANDDVEEIEGY